MKNTITIKRIKLKKDSTKQECIEMLKNLKGNEELQIPYYLNENEVIDISNHIRSQWD